MISLLIIICTMLATDFLCSSLKITNKLLRAGIDFLTSGIILYFAVLLFDIPVLSMRYGVEAEITNSIEEALFVTKFLALVGCVFMVIGLIQRYKNA